MELGNLEPSSVDGSEKMNRKQEENSKVKRGRVVFNGKN